jgi:uncharacterized lipoprotein
MQRLTKSVVIALMLSLVFGLSGCSMLTKSGRQERAYSKYVRKQSGARVKQQSRFRTKQPKMPTQPAPSEPTETTESGPESMPSEPSGE